MFNLTLTRVVFEFIGNFKRYVNDIYLTLTRVVFEYVLEHYFYTKVLHLTLTRVVFEYTIYKQMGMNMKFNFNKSCI